ncbi:hypothetical protein [Xanthomonas bundabergensis]|uniref:hypothetical protein n=1 Tax=Xanthomonas bundabergensis TaxID=3160842 RepID=UPI0035159AFF
MRAFNVRGIVWETNGKRPGLPAEAAVECESEGHIADALSDAYGWLVSTFVVVEETDGDHTRNASLV